MTMLMSFTDNNEEEIIKKHEEQKMAQLSPTRSEKKKLGSSKKLKS